MYRNDLKRPSERALRTGASGYWMKTRTREELVRAIETVLSDELYVSPGVALLAVHKVVEHPAAHLAPSDLTDRELHVFGLGGGGFGRQFGSQKNLGESENRGNVSRTYQAQVEIPDANALHIGAREWSELSHHK